MADCPEESEVMMSGQRNSQTIGHTMLLWFGLMIIAPLQSLLIYFVGVRRGAAAGLRIPMLNKWQCVTCTWTAC